jgi:hypothetical protein
MWYNSSFTKKLKKGIDSLRDRYQNTTILIKRDLMSRIRTRQVDLSQFFDTTDNKDRNTTVTMPFLLNRTSRTKYVMDRREN